MPPLVPPRPPGRPAAARHPHSAPVPALRPRCLSLSTALALAALLTAAAPAATAQTPGTQTSGTQTVLADTTRPDVVLAPVVVTALRAQTEAAEGAAHIVRLTRRDLDDLRVSTLADALERAGGASVRRYGPAGLATASLRGAASGQTAVLLDGLRLTDPIIGPVDLALVPAAVLGGVTTVSGAASAWHGPDAIAGAVLLDSRAARGLDLRAGVGTAGSVDADAAMGRATRHGAVAAALSVATSDGDFAYRDRTAFPARDAHRQGADLRRASALVRLDAGATRVGLWLAAADRGVPGAAGTAADAGARQRDALARVWGARTGTLGRGAHRTAWRAAAFAHLARLDYRGPGVLSRSIPLVVGAEAGLTRAVGAGVTLGGGVSGARASARNAALTDAPVEHSGAAWVYADLARGRWTLAPALRLDVAAQSGATYAPLSPRLGLRVGAAPGVALRVSAGRAFRAPSLSDRYWRGAGRADLRAERGWTADAGADLSRGTASLALTAWARRVADEIVWRPGAGGVWRPGNVRRTAAAGIDASGAATAGALRLRAAATVLDARDRSGDAATDGKRLPYVPAWTLRGDARADVARVRSARLTADIAASGTGRRTTTVDASTALPAFATVDVGAALAWALGGARVGIDMRLVNALGAEYALVEGYPMPGRALAVGVRVRW